MQVIKSLFFIVTIAFSVSTIYASNFNQKKPVTTKFDEGLAPKELTVLKNMVKLQFNYSHLKSACGIQIKWGDGEDTNIRVGRDVEKEGFAVDHTYLSSGSFDLEIRGKTIFKGLYTVPSCSGESVVETISLGRGQSSDNRLEVNLEKNDSGLLANAEAGDPESQYELGLRYETGDRLPYSPESAFSWFLSAAKQGHIQSQEKVGLAYVKGFGVQSSPSKAIKWLTVAAEAGAANAQLMLSSLYMNGIGTRQDKEEAMRFLMLAAENDSPEAQAFLAKEFISGRSLKKDVETGSRWLLRSANNGFAKAQVFVGNGYYKGTYFPKDPEQAIKWFRTAAENGSREGQFMTGRFYFEGYGTVDRDFGKAAYWINRSANQKYPEAQFVFGLMHEKGLGVPDDLRKAISLYRLSASAGVENAQKLLQSRGIKWSETPVDQENFGIGAVLNEKNGVIRISRILEGGAAATDGGLQQGDQILELSQGDEFVSVHDWGVDEIVANLKGQVGSPIAIRVKAEGSRKIREVELRRAPIKEIVGNGTTPKKNNAVVVSNQTNDQGPKIEILVAESTGPLGLIVGKVNDLKGVAEIQIGGDKVKADSVGQFTYKTYVPEGGANLQLIATNLSGVSSETTVFLDRQTEDRLVELSFDDLNPIDRIANPNPDALALVIGVANYEFAKAPAEFADKDAQVFKDYAITKLGVPENRVKTLINQGAGERELLLAVKAWLRRAVKQERSDVFVFFAGHGLASDDGNQTYLIPYDGAPELLEDTAISRERLFSDIAASNPNSVTVFLDTCYSGDSRGEERLISARPLGLKVQEQNVPNNFTVITAASGDQIARPLQEKQHGMFSYFLMKGMEGDADTNSDNQITARELHTYVRENVVQQSGGSQVPELQGDGEKVLVRFR